MPRVYRSARGEEVDFDALLIKQQLQATPMTVDVAARKQFIDQREEKPKRATGFVAVPDSVPAAEVKPEKTEAKK